MFSRRLLPVVALLLAVLATPAAAAPQPAALSPEQRETVERVRDYLNGITTLKADFVQVSSNGQQAEGTAYLKRPGRLRLEYAPPMPVLMVADGTWLAYYDSELEQASHVPIESSPAHFLLRQDVSFSGNVTLTNFEERRGLIRLDLVKTEAPGDGRLILLFTKHPLQLRQWSVVDPQGEVTTVTLMDQQTGMRLDERKLFTLGEPWFETSPNYRRPR